MKVWQTENAELPRATRLRNLRRSSSIPNAQSLRFSLIGDAAYNLDPFKEELLHCLQNAVRGRATRWVGPCYSTVKIIAICRWLVSRKNNAIGPVRVGCIEVENFGFAVSF